MAVATPSGPEADLTEIGRCMLRAAGLNIPEAEAEQLASVYGQIRELANSLYELTGDDTCPQLTFDPSLDGSDE